MGEGKASGPIPVDRSKPGTKHTLKVNEAGVSLVIRTGGADAGEHSQILSVILDLRQVGDVSGGPTKLPAEANTDRGYNGEPLRALLRWPVIATHFAERRPPSGNGLEEVRRVAERTIS